MGASPTGDADGEAASIAGWSEDAGSDTGSGAGPDAGFGAESVVCAAASGRAMGDDAGVGEVASGGADCNTSFVKSSVIVSP